MATNLVYAGRGTRAPGTPLPPDIDTWPDPPEGYIAGENLADAVNTALFLKQPLLVMGEPGTGKTQLAYSIAWELGLPLYKFDTKMSSAGHDLFYHYDSLLHFYDMQIRKKRCAPSRYITYAALGRAILASNDPSLVSRYLPPSLRVQHTAACQAVVLIDEIDKASRDFPNDILAETEKFSFDVRETGWSIAANRDLPPIVVITSNQERNLPDAFLRRCIYYYIPFPEERDLRAIVRRRLGGVDEHEVAIQKFLEIRRDDRIQKKPATAEFIAWVKLLRRNGVQAADLRQGTPLARRTYPVLLKHKDDLERYASSESTRDGKGDSARAARAGS